MKFCFVVLHYQNTEVTQQCVMCLRGLQNYCDIEIVIVDNASPNKSGTLLLELYKEVSNIYVLCNISNLGFANGNNIGYAFAKNELNADVIVVMNNDVLIEQKEFIRLLMRTVNETSAHIIAPDIINLDGIHQNPFRKDLISNKRLLKMYLYNMSLSYWYRVPVINNCLAQILNNRANRKSKDLITMENFKVKIVPHGACVIYKKEWINNEDFAFLPVTFMYFEEDILAEYAFKKGYRIMYCPELIVRHIEDASVKASTKTELKRRKFIATNMRKSIKELIRMRLL